MWENMDQKKFRNWILFSQCMIYNVLDWALAEKTPTSEEYVIIFSDIYWSYLCFICYLLFTEFNLRTKEI